MESRSGGAGRGNGSCRLKKGGLLILIQLESGSGYRGGEWGESVIGRGSGSCVSRGRVKSRSCGVGRGSGSCRLKNGGFLILIQLESGSGCGGGEWGENL